MKKIAPIFIMLIVFSFGAAQEQPGAIQPVIQNINATELITPSAAVLFAKSMKVQKLLETAQYVINNVVSQEQKLKIMNYRDNFRTKTGIDFLSNESLSQNGIDTGKPISAAYFDDPAKGKEGMLIYVPVLDPKLFPLKFVEVLKNLNKDRKDVDLFPAITEYGNNRIFQIHRDIFVTTINNFFIVGSTGELVRQVIDLSANPAGSLASDQLFVSYIQKEKNIFTINMFLRKEFLEGILAPILNTLPINIKDGSTALPSRSGIIEASYNPDDGFEALEIKSDAKRNAPAGGSPAKTPEAVKTTEEKKESVAEKPQDQNNDSKQADKDNARAADQRKKEEQQKLRLARARALFKNVEFAAFGLGFDMNRFKCNFALNFTPESSGNNSFFGLLNAGAAAECQYYKDADLFAFLGLNLKNLEAGNPETTFGYNLYSGIRNGINQNFGIDFAKDFLPYYSGGITAVMGQPKGFGGMGSFAINIPLTDAGKGRELYAKIRAALAGRFSANNMFGDIDGAGGKACWFLDAKNIRNYIYSNGRSLMVGSDIDLIHAYTSGEKIGKIKKRDLLVEKINGNTFFLLFIKKNTFISEILKMQAQKNREVGGALARLGDLYLTAERIERCIAIDIDAEILEQAQQK